MNAEAARQAERFMWRDYQSWPGDERWELIGGEAYSMTPSLSLRHQEILLALSVRLSAYLKGKPCKVYVAPIDVKLSDEDVVQPDLAIVCDPNQLKSSHVDGAPPLVIEIASPSTALYDRTRKLDLYARSGVKEVWIVTPYPWLAEVFSLDRDAYRLLGSYTKGDKLHSPSLPDLLIDLNEIFDFPLEPGEEIQFVREGRPTYATNPA